MIKLHEQKKICSFSANFRFPAEGKKLSWKSFGSSSGLSQLGLDPSLLNKYDSLDIIWLIKMHKTSKIIWLQY